MAVPWYKKAAIQGSSNAQYYLGVIYLEGKGMEKDENKALYWIAQSAKNDHPIGQVVYSRMLKDRNSTEAILWMRKAADQGYEPAIKYFLDAKKN